MFSLILKTKKWSYINDDPICIFEIKKQNSNQKNIVKVGGLNGEGEQKRKGQILVAFFPMSKGE